MKKTSRASLVFMILFCAVIAINLFLFFFLYSEQSKQSFNIAVAGPFTGPNEKLGLFMKQGAQLAVDEINKDGALDYVNLKLVEADDRSEYTSNYRPIETAKGLVKDPLLLGVIGHYFSGPARAASPIYKNAKVPIITPTATHPAVTRRNKWAFSIIFDDKYQANYLADFAVHVLKKKRITIIHSDIAYGISLKKAFTRRLARAGLKPVSTISIEQKNFKSAKLASYLGRLQKSDAVFLAVRYDLAAAITRYLKLRGVRADFFGGENVGSQRFIESAGLYAQNVYAVNSFLPNLLDEKARRFQQKFKDRYGETPDWAAAHTYEAVWLFAHAIRASGTRRRDIRRYLAGINSLTKAIPSIGGPIYFNKHGNNVRPVSMGQVKDGRYVSASAQLVPVSYPDLLKKRYRHTRLLKVQGSTLKQSTVVFTGLRITKFNEIKVTSGYFVAEARLWFRWKGKMGKLSFDLANGKILQKKLVEQDYNKKTGERYVSYHIQGRFRGFFPLQEYPFDEQVLKLQVRAKGVPTEDVLLVRDTTRGFDDLPTNLGMWLPGGALEYVDQQDYVFSLHNPRYKNEVLRLKQSVFNSQLTIKRRIIQYLIKLTPLFIIVLITYLIFFIDIRNYTPSRIAMGITALLSAVAFHMSQGNKGINIGYLIKADIFFIATYLLISLALVETVISSRFFNSGNEQAAAQTDKLAAIIFPFLIVGTVTGIYF